ncbi:MAG: hypothetical protein EHM93_16230 [Bacteroidales bacterium]|nr:MAG: hypothetical protein EHM93_16230 [Bacteroidales bacterium]
MKKLVILFSLTTLMLSGCVNNSNTKTHKPNSIEFEGNVVNGVKRIYNGEGKLETEIPYKDSLPEGIQKEYYKTGELYRETPLVKGRPNGLVKEFNTKGKLYREMPVVNGKANGVVKKYYENGILFSEAPFENGEAKEGLKEYNEKGELLGKPKMLFKGIDKVATDGVYIIEISLSDEYIQPSYANVITFEGKEMLNKIPIVNGKGIYKISIPKGAILNKKLTFEARYNTLRKNIFVLRDTYTMGLTNF